MMKSRFDLLCVRHHTQALYSILVFYRITVSHTPRCSVTELKSISVAVRLLNCDHFFS